MRIAERGKELKILNVTGTKGVEMPCHFSTKEAIIIVLKGEVLIKLEDKEIYLKPNQSLIIPASEPHTLSVKEDFAANVIMAIDSEIKFINN